MDLDFSKLDGLAYRGYESKEDRARKDAIIESGFKFVEGIATPFDDKKPPELTPVDNYPPISQKRSESQKKGLYDVSGTRNYNLLYRAAHDYHARHIPPRLDLDYCVEAAEDLGATLAAHGGDIFLQALLVAVYDELERDYKRLQDLEGTAIDKAS